MMEAFPIKTSPLTRASFSQRFDGTHEGTDIFAPAGAEVVAVAPGRIRQAVEPKGGKAVYLTESDGSQYYYAHLDAFAHPMAPTESRIVRAGEVIGYVGTTGNAKGAPPHVHFEWRPRGGSKQDPFFELQRLSAVVVSKPKQKAKQKARKAPSSNGGPQLGGGVGLLLLAFMLMRSNNRG